MLTRLVALLVLCRVLAVLGQESTTPVSYIRDLEQEPLHGRTVGVADGDSIKVLTAAKQQIRVRIAFIDAPEKGQPFGQRAKQAMSDLVFGKDIAVYPHAIDRYGRTVRIVYVSGVDAGLEMLKQGFAWTYRRYLSEASAEIQSSYRDAEAEARGNRRRLWSALEPIPPFGVAAYQ